MKKNSDTQSTLFLYFGIMAFIFVVLALMRVYYVPGFLMDTYEHIHSSWLVSEGLIPYRDFYEHHHPLLWYLFAPVTQLFYRDANIIYVARIIAVFGYLWTLYLTYVLARDYSKSKTGGLFAILFFLCVPSLWLDVQNLRPDIFMYISILAAIKYFFDYLDKHQIKYLCFSYFLWFVAFLFLQKALIIGFGFGLANFWLIYKKEMTWSDAAKASVVPLFLFLVLLAILYRFDLLKDYYSWNFLFNVIVKEHYGIHTAGFLKHFFYAVIITFLAVTLTYRYSYKGNTLFLMWLVAGLSSLDFAPCPQYYFLNFVLSAILLAPFFKLCYTKNTLLVLIILTLALFRSFYYLQNYKFSKSIKNDVLMIDYVIKNTGPHDKLLNGWIPHNLFNPDTDYYWFGFHNSVILADLYTDRSFDYNEQIRKYKPKFLFISEGNYDKLMSSNMVWIIRRNMALVQKAVKGDRRALLKITIPFTDYWQIDMGYIKEHYHKVKTFGATELWQRIDAEAITE